MALKNKKLKWFKRELHNENAVLVWMNILDSEYGVTPDRIKIVGLTIYFYNDKEI